MMTPVANGMKTPRFGAMNAWQKGAAALGVAGAALLGSHVIPDTVHVSKVSETTAATPATKAATSAKADEDIKLTANLPAQFNSQKSVDQKYKLLMKAAHALNAEGWDMHGGWMIDSLDNTSKTAVPYTDNQKAALLVRLTAAANANADRPTGFYRLQQINSQMTDTSLQTKGRRFLALAELYRDYQRNKDDRPFSVDHLEEYYRLQSELAPAE